MRFALVVLVLASCASTTVREQRMAFAPTRPADCPIELVNDEPTSPTFNQKWQLLGYVYVQGAPSPDPFAPQTRELVHAHACGMGATSVMPALGMAGAGGNTLVFMVLRPHAGSDIHAPY